MHPVSALRFSGFSQPTNPRFKNLAGKDAALIRWDAKAANGFILKQAYEAVTVNSVSGHGGREIKGFRVPAHVPAEADKVDLLNITHPDGRTEDILVGEYSDGLWQRISVCMAESGKRLLKKHIKNEPYNKTNTGFATIQELAEQINLFHPANEHCYPNDTYA